MQYLRTTESVHVINYTCPPVMYLTCMHNFVCMHVLRYVLGHGVFIKAWFICKYTCTYIYSTCVYILMFDNLAW